MTKKSLKAFFFKDFSFGSRRPRPKRSPAGLAAAPGGLYRRLAYLATTLTGFASLCGQVVWQKYLNVLVGSEARSTTLVVAVFLFGLSLGYWAFGRLTKKRGWSRFWLLKIYGYVEIATALYLGAFYLYFSALKTLSFNSPPLFVIDLLIACLAILLPAFLMGASIPVLTAALPETSEEAGAVHAKIYGWNTLGACLGALVSAFWLLPVFGLDLTLAIAAGLNFLAALVFMGNYLKGGIQKPAPPPAFESAAPNSFYLVFAFLTGAIIISLEILVIRVLNLSLGAGVFNFPIILALFVGGLALGSLSVKQSRMSAAYLIRQLLFAIACALMIFGSAPYWSIWLSHIRVSLANIPSNYMVFKALAILALALFLLPAAFFMGRFLPIVYSLLKKKGDNYGDVCGRLYFFNTLGTVFGAVFGGHLLLYFLDIDLALKIQIWILIFLALILALFEKKNFSLAALAALSLLFLALPGRWDRTGHHLGYFRIRSYHKDLHFKTLFALPKKSLPSNAKAAFFKDGPNTTVTLLNHSGSRESAKAFAPLFPGADEKTLSYSIIVNGKSDGNTLGDFSTMFLASSLPYLLLRGGPDEKFSAAVIGLGTGVSAGALGQMEAISDVSVLEISPAVIEAISLAPPALNFKAMRNPKIKIFETDAFRHFTRNRKKYDLIVSEPTNPWTAGTENLFTPEFFRLASRSLSETGILAQWMQTYDIDESSILMMLGALKKVFPYVELYQIGLRDLAAVASRSPLREDFAEDKFSEVFLKKYHRAMGIFDSRDLHLARALSQQQISWLASYPPAMVHTISQPQLSYRADRAFFTGYLSDPFRMAPEFLPNFPADSSADARKAKKRRQAFKAYIKKRGGELGLSGAGRGNSKKISQTSSKKGLSEKGGRAGGGPGAVFSSGGFNFLRAYLKTAAARLAAFENPKAGFQERFKHYSLLRSHGLLPADEGFLNECFQKMMEGKKLAGSLLFSYISQRLKAAPFEAADAGLSEGPEGRVRRDLALLKSKGMIGEKTLERAEKHIAEIKKIQSQWLNPAPDRKN